MYILLLVCLFTCRALQVRYNRAAVALSIIKTSLFKLPVFFNCIIITMGIVTAALCRRSPLNHFHYGVIPDSPGYLGSWSPCDHYANSSIGVPDNGERAPRIM